MASFEAIVYFMVDSTICFKAMRAVGWKMNINDQDYIAALSLALSPRNKAYFQEILAVGDDLNVNIKERITGYGDSYIRELLEDPVFHLGKQKTDVLSQLTREFMDGTLINFLNTNDVLPAKMSQLLLDRVVYSSLKAVSKAGRTLFRFNKSLNYIHIRGIRTVTSFEMSRGESSIRLGETPTLSIKLGLVTHKK